MISSSGKANDPTSRAQAGSHRQRPPKGCFNTLPRSGTRCPSWLRPLLPVDFQAKDSGFKPDRPLTRSAATVDQTADLASPHLKASHQPGPPGAVARWPKRVRRWPGTTPPKTRRRRRSRSQPSNSPVGYPAWSYLPERTAMATVGSGRDRSPPGQGGEMHHARFVRVRSGDHAGLVR
jgi:hypothetical protein